MPEPKASDSSVNSRAPRPASTAITMLDVSTITTTPVSPPIASEPGILPKMRRAIGPATSTPTKRNTARSCQLNPLLLPGRSPKSPLRASTSGSGSPLTRAISWSAAASQAAGKVVLPESRLHRVVDDVRGGEVGHRAFERLRHFDAHLAVVLGDDDENAVADLLAPDLPGIADAVGIAGDVFGLRGRDHQHHDLRALLLFEGLQLGFERRALGVVSVPVWSMTRASSFGTGSRPCACAPKTAHSKRTVRARRMRAAVMANARAYFFGALKSTVGGVEICASFCTVKLGLGS